MSTTDTSAADARAADDQQPVSVVGDDAACEAIVEVLVRERFAPSRFASVQAFVEAEREDERAPVVLWLEDPVSSVPHDIEPLSAGLEHRPPVVMVCPSIERWELRAALSVGVTGVVILDEMHSRLGSCLRAVLVGQVCVPRDHWRQVEPPALSAREKQVLGLVVMGFMNSEIAERLFLAESTVKSHLSSAFGKLGVRSRNEAAELIARRERGLDLGMLGVGMLGVDRERLAQGAAKQIAIG